MCVCVCVYVYILVHVCVSMWRYVYSVYVCVCISSNVFGCVVQRFRFVWWDSDPLQEIWICIHSGPDTMVIRRLIHGMIRRSVPVRVVKTRWRFGSKITSFHVSICYSVFSYLLLSVCVYMLLLSFHMTFYYILPVWLFVALHETSMIIHFIYVVDMSLY